MHEFEINLIQVQLIKHENILHFWIGSVVEKP